MLPSRPNSPPPPLPSPVLLPTALPSPPPLRKLNAKPSARPLSLGDSAVPNLRLSGSRSCGHLRQAPALEARRASAPRAAWSAAAPRDAATRRACSAPFAVPDFAAARPSTGAAATHARPPPPSPQVRPKPTSRRSKSPPVYARVASPPPPVPPLPASVLSAVRQTTRGLRHAISIPSFSRRKTPPSPSKHRHSADACSPTTASPVPLPAPGPMPVDPAVLEPLRLTPSPELIRPKRIADIIPVFRDEHWEFDAAGVDDDDEDSVASETSSTAASDEAAPARSLTPTPQRLAQHYATNSSRCGGGVTIAGFMGMVGGRPVAA